MSAQVMVIRPGDISPDDKAKLEAAGIVCIEANNPDDVRLLSAEPSPLTGNQLFAAAIQAIASADDFNTARTLAKNLAQLSKEPT